ncbi:MAG: thioredoxin domain-containing protein, partial [Chloroflexota bacterium]|nr:thioredoxin domain-containing protein [Chloroflexota bacterium]
IANAEFVVTRLRAPATESTTASTPGEGAPSGWRLLRSYKDGQAKFNAYLEDYACYADGLLALYEATFDVRWYTAAQGLAETMVAQFADAAGGGFFDTSADHERLLTRPKDLYDNATPAGNSVAADVLLRLDAYSGESRSAPAEALLHGLAGAMAQHPTAFGRLLGALDFTLGPTKEIAIIGEPDAPETQALLDVVFQRYLPNRVVALASPGAAGATAVDRIPLLADRPQQDGRATAYVCEHFTCQLPATEPEALARQLERSAS